MKNNELLIIEINDFPLGIRVFNLGDFLDGYQLEQLKIGQSPIQKINLFDISDRLKIVNGQEYSLTDWNCQAFCTVP